MKSITIAVTLGSLILIGSGCKPASEPSAQSTADQLDKAKTETKAAAQDMDDYAFARKEEFVAKMQVQLDELNRDLDQLGAKIEKASDAVKAEAKPKLDALHAQAVALTKQLDAARKADGTTWDAVKADSRKAYGSMKDSFNQARQWVSDKIAP